MSDTHTFPVIKIQFTEQPVPSLKTPNAELTWKPLAGPGLSIIFRLKQRYFTEFELRDKDGQSVLCRTIPNKNSDRPAFTPTMTHSQERILFKYAWPVLSTPSESNERVQIRLKDEATAKAITDLLRPFFGSVISKTGRRPATSTQRRKDTETQAELPMETQAPRREMVKPHLTERYNRSPDRSPRPFRQRQSRSASPKSDPHRHVSRYRESPTSTDIPSARTARPERNETVRLPASRTPWAERVVVEHTDAAPSRAPSRPRQEMPTIPSVKPLPLSANDTEHIGDRSLDEAEDQLDVPPLQPVPIVPVQSSQPLINLEGSPELPFGAHVAPTSPYRRPIHSPHDLIHLQEIRFDEPDGDLEESEYGMQVMQPTGMTRSQSAPTTRHRPIYTSRPDTLPRVDEVPLPTFPPMLPNPPSYNPPMPTGQRLYDLREHDLDIQIDAILRERGLPDLVLRIADCLARRSTPHDLQLSHSQSHYSQHSSQGYSNFAPHHPQQSFLQHSLQYSQSDSQADGSQSSQHSQFSQQYNQSQAPYRYASEPFQGQQQPQPQQYGYQPQQHVLQHWDRGTPLMAYDGISRWQADDGGFRSADTTLDDDFEAQMEGA